MGNFKDLTGMKFGRLTVLEFAGRKNKRTYFKCRCECGKEIIARSDGLVSGHCQSCGCRKKEIVAKTAKSLAIHGLSYDRIHGIWDGIKARCYNPHRKSYKDYGGRGITMCSEWKDNFQAFYEYVSKLEHYGEKGYSLDRIDNNGNYEPENVRWADNQTQANNKRNNHLVEYEGEVMTLLEASRASGVKCSTLSGRISRGDTGDRLFRPVRNKRNDVMVEYQGVKMTLAEAAEKSNVNADTLRFRMKRGETGEYLFRLPK